MSSITCPKCRSNNIVGVEVIGVYDGCLYWRCAMCSFAFQRFSPDSALGKLAAKYIQQANARNDEAVNALGKRVDEE